MHPSPLFDAPGHPPATITEHQGVRFLHLGTSWIQGAMRLAKPDQIELEYVRMMMIWLLFCPRPRHLGLLGLGCGALAKFCYQRFPQADVTVAELNPNVIAAARALFGLPENDRRLDVRQMDAFDLVRDPRQRGRLDVLQVDLYDEHARGPVLDSPEFYQACADCLSEQGIMTVNVFGEFDNYERNLHNMGLAFDAVVWLPEVDDANIIALAFKRAPQIDFSELYGRANQVRKEYNLDARKWVDGLKEWMRDQADA
jgi:spermidine synthase